MTGSRPARRLRFPRPAGRATEARESQYDSRSLHTPDLVSRFYRIKPAAFFSRRQRPSAVGTDRQGNRRTAKTFVVDFSAVAGFPGFSTAAKAFFFLGGWGRTSPPRPKRQVGYPPCPFINRRLAGRCASRALALDPTGWSPPAGAISARTFAHGLGGGGPLRDYNAKGRQTATATGFISACRSRQDEMAWPSISPSKHPGWAGAPGRRLSSPAMSIAWHRFFPASRRPCTFLHERATRTGMGVSSTRAMVECGSREFRNGWDRAVCGTGAPAGKPWMVLSEADQAPGAGVAGRGHDACRLFAAAWQKSAFRFWENAAVAAHRARNVLGNWETPCSRSMAARGLASPMLTGARWSRPGQAHCRGRLTGGARWGWIARTLMMGS